MKENKNRSVVFINTLITGFFGGILLASVHLLFQYFNVSKVKYRHILAFFYIDAAWLEKWYGYLFFIFFMGILSIIIALLYYFLFKRIRGWVFGAFFGLCIWLIFGLLIPVLYYDVTFSTFYKSYTNVLNVCALLLYGLFIGYSISYDEEMSEHDVQNG